MHVLDDLLFNLKSSKSKKKKKLKKNRMISKKSISFLIGETCVSTVILP